MIYIDFTLEDTRVIATRHVQGPVHVPNNPWNVHYYDLPTGKMEEHWHTDAFVGSLLALMVVGDDVAENDRNIYRFFDLQPDCPRPIP